MNTLFRTPAFTTLQGEMLENTPQLTRIRFPVDVAWFDAFGELQSGICSAMFDVTIDACIAAHSVSRRFSTLESSVRYFRTIHKGHLIFDATILRAGHALITVEAIAWDMANELCAKATATKLLIS